MNAPYRERHDLPPQQGNADGTALHGDAID